MIARVYFSEAGIMAVCTGHVSMNRPEDYVEINVLFDVGIADFEMHKGVPRLRPADSPPRRFGFIPPEE